MSHYLLAFRVRPLGLDHQRPTTKSVQASLGLDILLSLVMTSEMTGLFPPGHQTQVQTSSLLRLQSET